MVLRCDSTTSFLLCKTIPFIGVGNNRDVTIDVVVSLEEGCVSVIYVFILDVLH